MVLKQLLISLDNISFSGVVHAMVFVIYRRFILSHDDLGENFILSYVSSKKIALLCMVVLLPSPTFIACALCEYRETSNISHTKLQNFFLASSCACLCPISWGELLSQEWRFSWNSANKRCSNYTWVINYFIAYLAASYIRGLALMAFISAWSCCGGSALLYRTFIQMSHWVWKVYNLDARQPWSNAVYFIYQRY